MRGQSLVETLCGMTLMLLLVVAGSVLMIHILGSLILSKWASRTSHCIAQGEEVQKCSLETVQSLQRNFAFKKVHVQVKPWRGVIHTEVDARLIGHTLLRSTYDLEPSEYKRKQR